MHRFHHEIVLPWPVEMEKTDGTQIPWVLQEHLQARSEVRTEEQLFGVRSSGRIGHGSTWRSSARIAHGAIMLGYKIFLKMFKHGYLMGGGFWGQNSKFSGISDIFLAFRNYEIDLLFWFLQALRWIQYFAFQLCGHAQACEQCCSKITYNSKNAVCPICRKVVTQYQQIYI